MTEQSSPTFWMNVTTSANWQRSPVGIVRVEQELRRQLASMLGDRLRTIVLKDGEFISSSGRPLAMSDSDDFWPEPSYGSSLDVFDPAERRTKTKVGASPHAGSSYKPGFNYGDVLITVGLDWEHPGLHDKIRSLAEAYNLTVLTCCYDLIPVLYPQYCVSDVATWFKNYLIKMTWISDGVLCISERTRSDYLNFVDQIGLPVRATEVIRLGSALPAVSEGELSLSPEVSTLVEGRYFLFVSTIERRKNHEVLYRAYHLIRREHPDIELPKLVFVGMQGWGVNDLMSDIRLDPLTQGDIVVLPHVSDEELHHLYANCEAFLFPSHYEGWGLPIAEALQFGKPVLASASGSIPEVGGDLVRYLHPWEPSAWANELLAIARGQVDLAAWSQRIANKFVPYEWSAAARTVIALADHLRTTKPRSRTFEAGHSLSTVNGTNYGNKIIYSGQEGIICHGPYANLAEGRYRSHLRFELVEPAAGNLRFKVACDGGSDVLAKLDLDVSQMPLGTQEVIIPFDLAEPVHDFELICEAKCRTDLKLSVDHLEIKRLGHTSSIDRELGPVQSVSGRRPPSLVD